MKLTDENILKSICKIKFNHDSFTCFLNLNSFLFMYEIKLVGTLSLFQQTLLTSCYRDVLILPFPTHFKTLP